MFGVQILSAVFVIPHTSKQMEELRYVNDISFYHGAWVYNPVIMHRALSSDPSIVFLEHKCIK